MIPAGLTWDDLVAWMRRSCEAKHPDVPFQPLPCSANDLVELESG